MHNKTELEKSKPHFLVRLTDYVLDSVVAKSIIKKFNGNISIMAFDKGEGMAEKITPFDSFAQVIEGKAVIVINKVPFVVQSGQGIVIPAESPISINPNGQFKILMTNLGGKTEGLK